MSHIQSRDGTVLHVKHAGEGRPVILIHGWPLTGDMWEYQTLALIEAGYRVITYDRRGFGQSAHPARGYDYDNFADNPDGVDPSVFEEMKAKIRQDRFAFLGDFAKMFYGVGVVSKPVSRELLDWTFILATMASPKATLDCVDAFATTDFRRDLAAFTVPTLVIHGTADKTVPIEPTGRAVAAALPAATFIEYAGEPHGLFATAPERLNRDLIEFIGTSTVQRQDAGFMLSN